MTPEGSKVATLIVETTAKLNFACHQSAFPFLRDLRVNNNHETPLEDVTVQLSSDPSFLKPRSWRVDRITPNGSVTIKNRDIELDGNFLLKLADSVRGTVTITIEANNLVLDEIVKPVQLLAYNEWGGAGYMPELLAAFCVPNDPAVDRVLRDASLILRKAGKPDGIDAYKAGSRQRVWEIASAIYTAICNLGITYVVPPASFERDGQKIRLPGDIIENRVATCLDSTMLFASAIEQAGLNPIVVLPKGHAVVGVWLQPGDLSTIVIDEAETLRKRIQLKELVLIETTCVTSHPAIAFSRAVTAATETITSDKDKTFDSAVDIRRARAHRISPLGLKTTQPSTSENSDHETHIKLAFEEAPSSLPDFDDIEDEEPVDSPSDRIGLWKRKLLDLSARNPLLNHTTTKSSLRLLCPDPALLEDKLAQGARIAIKPIPELPGQQQDEHIHQQRTGEIITTEYAKDALDNGQVLVNLAEEDLSNRAVTIYRKAQTSLQEGGANTLYLALGFLLWKRKIKEDRRFRAPLILLPVTLERKSVRSGIRMLAHDDEPHFNTTLLEMLRKDFAIDIKGLDADLPTDQSGIDVIGVWNIVRKAVKEAPGFEVVEDVVLGHFSFAKYLMWKDLVDRTDALRNSAIVKHLIDTPRDQYHSNIDFVDATQVGREYEPSDLLTPLPADSSQMSAIATADRGKDFVIIGPPGTGKSQTISNMIANLLGKGKTVLFVSGKTAALEAVHRRLRDIGLGKFCLELHSNKASKADVLKQLQEAWESHEPATAEIWEAEANRLSTLRDTLNCVVDRLHITRGNGMTAHYAMGVKVRDEDLAARVVLSWPRADQHDEAKLNEMRDAVEKLRIQAEAVGDISDSPFKSVSESDWSPQWESQVSARANQLLESTVTLRRSIKAFLEGTGIVVPDYSLERIYALAELAPILIDSYRKPIAYALEPSGQDRIDALEEAVQCLKRYSDAQTRLSCSYSPMAWRTLDGDVIAQRWQNAETLSWPKSFFVRRHLIKDMMEGGARGKPDPARDAITLQILRKEGQAIDRLDKLLSTFNEWKGHTTDPEVALTLQKLGESVRRASGKLADDAPTLDVVRKKIVGLIRDNNDLLAPDAAFGRLAEKLIDSYRKFDKECGAFKSICGQSISAQFAESDNVLDAIETTTSAIAQRHSELREWCGWRRRRTEAMHLDLGPLVDAVENGRIPIDEIEATFEAAYCTWWSTALIGEDDILRTFSTPEHTEAIHKFRETDDRFRKLTASYIRASLMGNIPDSNNFKRSSSWGTLRHEIQKKKRHKPVRQLIQEIPDALMNLTPCLMMSPLSVAQYLPADQQLFDVVIFDEASQITVWDAIGCLARGKQAVVAGDPKQMPPTNFFTRSDEDADNDVDTEGDLDSILDELLGASIPKQTLNLHYRSRKESLIAFSNSRYYDNELITFPPPVHPDQGVRLIRPEGFYARGKARHNQGEAKAIVSEILRRITHKNKAIRQQSIGVVTFNIEQQALIENLLDTARLQDPGIEWAFSTDNEYEPIFVKNLETVQGDERDVIMFSITYGPDQSDHVTMNFGPLNRNGGERRLNVAMTRARSEMLVYSTLDPDRIDMSRTQSRAVMDLKHFLQYAKSGPSALGAATYGSMGDFESPFESAVAGALRDKGWNIHPQVGVSAYRIDLGVVHPDKPGVYLAGIECDGATYHSSTFARERDKIRQSVLESLGWTLLRIWSTDWWTNKAKALDILDKALTECLESDHLKRKKQIDDIEAAAEETILIDDQFNTENPNAFQKNSKIVAAVEESGTPKTSLKLAESAIVTNSPPIGSAPRHTPLQENVVANSTPPENRAHHYIRATLEEEGFQADPDMFYSKEYTHRLSAMINHIIDTEGPIHEDVLIRRIARHHGFQRAGREIRDIVISMAKLQSDQTHEDVGLFFWRRGTPKEVAPQARYSGRDDELRKVAYICKEEIRAIRDELSLDNDPIKIARCIGIARITQSTRKRINNVIQATPAH